MNDAVEWNSIRMVRVGLDVPLRFYRSGANPSHFVTAMQTAGFDVAVEPHPSGDYSFCWVDVSVNDTVRLAMRAFPSDDAAQFAYLAWRVHVDDAVQAAYRLGGIEAASALLTSEWVNAQDLP